MRIRTYIPGIIPCLIWLAIVSVPIDHGSAHIVFSWWAVYLILSYVTCFPRGYRWLRQAFRHDKSDAIQWPRKNADQESLRTGSSYVNTGKMGVARIGDATGKEGRLSQWGTDFVGRLFVIVAAPIIVGVDWFKNRR